MNEKILLEMSAEDLEKLIEKSFTKVISKLPAKVEEDKLMSRGEVALLFGVSLVTINTWCRIGKLKPHHMHSRVYFFKSEVMAQLLKQK
jgi:Helix-turn-helix domain